MSTSQDNNTTTKTYENVSYQKETGQLVLQNDGAAFYSSSTGSNSTTAVVSWKWTALDKILTKDPAFLRLQFSYNEEEQPPIVLSFVERSERDQAKADMKERRQNFLDKEAHNKTPSHVLVQDPSGDEMEAVSLEPPSSPGKAQSTTPMLLLVEIVSCKDLMVGDKHSASPDPYCKVKMSGVTLHETKHLRKTLNPVFGKETHNAFVLEVKPNDVVDFKVKDWDFFGSKDDLGTAHIFGSELIKLVQQPVSSDFLIQPPYLKSDSKAGWITLKARVATEEDVQLHGNKKKSSFFGHTMTHLLPAKRQQQQPTSPKTANDSSDKNNAALPAPTNRAIDTADEGVEKTSPAPQVKGPLWIEIVSCSNLLSADRNGLSDPYVKVKWKDKDLHETKHILKNLNPKFSPETNSWFVFDPSSTTTSNAALSTEELVFKVKDWDMIGKNDDLGQVQVPLTILYDEYAAGKVKDRQFNITPPKGKERENAGTISIRWRPATEEDQTKQQSGGFFQMLGGAARDRSVADKQDDLFIEVVSCRNLLAADKTGMSDPYVKIKLGKRDLHETKHRIQTLNPVFTEDTNNSFILEASRQEVQNNSGLVFKVKDWDRFGANDELGQVTVSSKELFEANGKSVELKIDPPAGKEKEDAGFLTIRCRQATDADRTAKKGIFRRLGFHSNDDSGKDYGTPDLSLLIEIVSAWGLPKADVDSTDPYVKVKLGGRNIHETKTIFNTLEPIYTVETDSLFILNATTEELKEKGGLLFKVKDYDVGMKNDDVCSVKVPAETLLEATGEREEFKLHPASWVEGNDAGHIAIRCRPASDYDREFIAHFGGGAGVLKKQKDFLDIGKSFNSSMKTEGGTHWGKTLLKQRKKTVKGVTKYRVRPHPDPTCPERTEWMSKDDIHSHALKKSKRWLDAGSGSLGRIFVEIIGADGLPNKDLSLGTGNKTDAFVAIVYEDCVVKTDVVDDCLSPRWLPWMQRAFIFRMMHVSSNLHIAAFDYDPGSNCDMCGRVSIDLSNLRPDTEYLLRYNLYENSMEGDRQQKGVLTVRLRMQLKNERSLMLSNLRFPPETYVNVKSFKDFELIRQTVGGRHDVTVYNKKTIQLYVDELLSHQYVRYFINDAAVSLLFWRGQVRFCGNISLPIYSLILFLAMITMAELPWLFPSFLCFGISWIFLCVQDWKNSSPNPWDKTKSFRRLMIALVVGSTLMGPDSIKAHENEEEAVEYEQKLKERIEKAKADDEKYREEQMKLLEEHEAQLAGPETAADISTRKGGVSLDPFKPVLYPIQQYLAKICTVIRFTKNVLLWNEPYYAFFLTAAFMLLGLIFMVTPWGFIFKWLGRIIAWGVFGPHMKLVDIFWYRKIDNSDEARTFRLKENLKAQIEQAEGLAGVARVQRENALKLMAMKKVLFGEYVTNVPVLRLERFSDVPLHSSMAKPFDDSERELVESLDNVKRVKGQHLVGDMIPTLYSEEEDDDDGATQEQKSIGTKKSDESHDIEASNGSKTAAKGASEETPLLAKPSPKKNGGFLSKLFSSDK